MKTPLKVLRSESPGEIARLWEDLWPALEPSRCAQCALDIALWDLAAKRAGTPVARLATGIDPSPVTTFCTIGLSGRAGLDIRMAEVAGFPRIKIKSDADADPDRIRHIAGRARAFAVDANGAWTAAQVSTHAPVLAEMGALFLEQPLPPAEDGRMARLLRESPLPILADESCVTEDDVERMPGRFSGFNIKLVKCGGLTPALRMARRGRELGLAVMTGCMLESSLLIAAGMVVAAKCDHADLDGAWLLRDDPFEGVTFDCGVLEISGGTGLGVAPRAG